MKKAKILIPMMGFLAMSTQLIALSSCGCSHKEEDTPIFSISTTKPIEVEDDKATVYVDWDLTEHRILFTEGRFQPTGGQEVVSTEIVEPTEESRPQPIKIVFSESITTSISGTLSFSYNDQTTQKEGSGSLTFTIPEPEPEPKGEIFNIALAESGGHDLMKQFKLYVSDEKREDAESYHLDGVEVKFTDFGDETGAYLYNLEEYLPVNATLPEEQKIDMFFADAQYVYYYVNSEYSSDISQLGFERTDFTQDGYEFAVDVCTDVEKQMKGVCLNFCPSVLIYKRDIALNVIGSDDPVMVQQKVLNWDNFLTLAQNCKGDGYFITPSYESIYRTMYCNLEKPWVDDTNHLVIDQALEKWANMTMTMIGESYTSKSVAQWSWEWTQQLEDNGRSFCEFGPYWLYTFSFPPSSSRDWGVCAGPEASYWGGSYLLAATGGNNDDEVKKTIEAFNDATTLKQICYNENCFVNSKTANNIKANDDNYKNPYLNGQNDWKIFTQVADKLEYKNATSYDVTFNDQFKTIMLEEFFEGRTGYDGAIDLFKKWVTNTYPEIEVD